METNVEFKNLPEWVKGIFAAHNMKPKDISVVSDSTPTIGGNWHDSNVKTTYFYKDGHIEKQKMANNDSYVNSSEKEKALYQGGKINLQPGEMVLEINSYPKGGKLFVNPSNFETMLPIQNEITSNEKIVLIATRSYKPHGRYEEAHNYTKITKDDYETAKQNLIANGYLNAAGAITTKGKNAVGWESLSYVNENSNDDTTRRYEVLKKQPSSRSKFVKVYNPDLKKDVFVNPLSGEMFDMNTGNSLGKSNLKVAKPKTQLSTPPIKNNNSGKQDITLDERIKKALVYAYKILYNTIMSEKYRDMASNQMDKGDDARSSIDYNTAKNQYDTNIEYFDKKLFEFDKDAYKFLYAKWEEAGKPIGKHEKRERKNPTPSNIYEWFLNKLEPWFYDNINSYIEERVNQINKENVSSKSGVLNSSIPERFKSLPSITARAYKIKKQYDDVKMDLETATLEIMDLGFTEEEANNYIES